MKKWMLVIFSILIFLFLTAQTCTFAFTDDECFGEDAIVCDGEEAYQCQLASYGGGYYKTRASGYDSECIEVSEETEVVVVETVEVDSDNDTVPDSEDACSNFDDNDDQDNDLIPDGCDDSDDDWLTDYEEINMYGTDPNNEDSDGDGSLDGAEILNGDDPLDSTDTSGTFEVSDHISFSGTNTVCSDTEGVVGDETVQRFDVAGIVTGGYWKDTESILGSGEDFCSTRGKLIEFACYDSDTSLFYKIDCSMYGTAYSCNEGACVSSDPETTDADGDGLTDEVEVVSGTNIFDDDTDGDGALDSAEIDAGTDPLDLNDPGLSSSSTEGTILESCDDSDGGQDYTQQGTTVGVYSSTMDEGSWTDNCQGDGKVGEFYCKSDNTVYVTYVDCATVVGEGYWCEEGRCITDSDGTATYTDSDADNDITPSAMCASDADCGTDESCYDELCFANSADTDGDGLLNRIEIEQGFDPQSNDLDDSLVLDLLASSGDVIRYGNVWDNSLPSDQPTLNYVSGEQYLTFDGDDYLQFADEDSLDFTTWFIIDAVVRTDESYLSNTHGPFVVKTMGGTTCDTSLGYNAYILKQYKTGYQFATLASGSTSRTFVPSSSSGVGSTSSDIWTHVTGVWDGSSLYIYTDGILQSSNAQASLTETTGDLKIGTACRYFFHGDIKDVKIWGEYRSIMR